MGNKNRSNKLYLHSNGTVANRIVRKSDGSISVVWQDHFDILTDANGSKSLRGIGYNHFDPITLTWIGGREGEFGRINNGCASAYVESPEIINTESGKEVVITHFNGLGNGGISKTDRNVVGEGNYFIQIETKIGVEMEKLIIKR